MIKVTMAIQEAGIGWSENWVLNLDDPADFIKDTRPNAEDVSDLARLIGDRSEMLNTDSRVLRVRASKIGVPGKFLVAVPSFELGRGKQDAARKSTEAFVALLCEYQSAGGTAHRPIYFGGLPEDIILPPTTYKPTAVFSQDLERFRTTTTKTPYVINSRPSRTTGLGLATITSFEVGSTGRYARVGPVTQPPGNPLTWYVLIRGLKNPRGWNGVHRAIQDGTTPFMIIGPTKKTMVSEPAFVAQPGQTVLPYVTIPAVADSLVAVRVVSRQRGRPFGLSVGRRS